MDPRENKSVLIVGAGVFGLSSAIHLLERGWKKITVIDRSPILPAPDAASTDLNKIVRSSYSDPAYTRLAREALTAWKNYEAWGDTYHECGLILRAGKGARPALENDIAHGVRTKELQTPADLYPLFPEGVSLGPSLTSDFKGYVNFDSGWANATQGVEIAMAKVCRLGGQIESNKDVTGLTDDGHGVQLTDGTEIRADLIIIAIGSWTPSTFSNLGIAERVLATGHCIATVQLSEEEAKIYSKVPIILDYVAGFYILPPNASNVIRFGIHSAGYTHTSKGVSTPRTHVERGAIPLEMLKALHQGLAATYPDLGQRPFASTRMCWFADTQGKSFTMRVSDKDSDWLIDFHPKYPSVLFATGGSGHAYKFLPVLGRFIADRIEGTLDSAWAQKFAFDRVFQSDHLAHLIPLTSLPKELVISQLCNPQDLP